MSKVDDDLHRVRARIVDDVMDSIKFLAPATLVIAIYRSRLIGIHGSISVIIFFSVISIIAINKNRLGFQFKAVSLVATIVISSLVMLFELGLLSPGAICFLAITPSLIWVFFGKRAAFVSSAVTIGCAGAIGLHVILGHHLPPFDVAAYMVSPTAWISTIAMICICGWLLFFIFSAYAGSLAAEVRRRMLTLEDANSRLMDLSNTDGLTDLANRRQFDDCFADEWARGIRSRLPLTLIMLDIDYFKKYNDCYGHQAGDDCLIRIARVLQASARRTSDLAARYGGEEFTLILPGANAIAARRLAEALRSSIELLNIPHENSPNGHVTASIGVATVVPTAGKDAKTLLRAADEALYRAKNGGKNRISVATSNLQYVGLNNDIPKDFVQLAWQPAYESGHAQIDDEHRILFDHATSLLAAVLSGRQEADVANLMAVLLHNVEQHFRNEENILEAAGFPEAKKHARAHRELLDRAAALGKGGPLAGGELFQFLAYDLVARHVLGTDREYFSHLKNYDRELSQATAPPCPACEG